MTDKIYIHAAQWVIFEKAGMDMSKFTLIRPIPTAKPARVYTLSGRFVGEVWSPS